MRVQFEQCPQKSGKASPPAIAVQAIHRTGQHQSQRVFARSVRSGKNDACGKRSRASISRRRWMVPGCPRNRKRA